MTLTKEQINIISTHPLGDMLDRARELLRDNENDDLQKQGIIPLLGALLASTAAFYLPSADTSPDPASNLFSLLSAVRTSQVNTDQFLPLVTHVVEKSSDIDIWKVAYDILNSNTADPVTPPKTVLPVAFTGTPIKASSSRLADDETREVVEREPFLRDQRLYLPRCGWLLGQILQY